MKKSLVCLFLLTICRVNDYAQNYSVKSVSLSQIVEKVR